MGKGLEQTSPQRRPTNGEQVYKQTLNIISHEGNVNKTTMRYHLTPVRIAINKTIENSKCGQVPGETEPSHAAGGNGKWYSRHGNQHGSPSKRL